MPEEDAVPRRAYAPLGRHATSREALSPGRLVVRLVLHVAPFSRLTKTYEVHLASWLEKKLALAVFGAPAPAFKPTARG